MKVNVYLIESCFEEYKILDDLKTSEGSKFFDNEILEYSLEEELLH